MIINKLNKRKFCKIYIYVYVVYFKDMFIQSCLQRTISNSQLIISIRTFKRFGEYVKGYGHEPKYYQGGNSIIEL
jgi:hypothetical protein